MPTQLTDPIIKVAATQATVDKWVLDLARGGDFNVDPSQSVFQVTLNLRDGLGNIIETRTLQRTIQQLPAPIKAECVRYRQGLSLHCVVPACYQRAPTRTTCEHLPHKGMETAKAPRPRR